MEHTRKPEAEISSGDARLERAVSALHRRNACSSRPRTRLRRSLMRLQPHWTDSKPQD
jgi:hypothetical protein